MIFLAALQIRGIALPFGGGFLFGGLFLGDQGGKEIRRFDGLCQGFGEFFQRPANGVVNAHPDSVRARMFQTAVVEHLEKISKSRPSI
jgi:hypothetical protein